MADRIVVMNQGAIEQVGTAMQVYRDPATLFVADFVGRINVLPASARRRRAACASARTCFAAHARSRHAAGRELRVYLRPEDVLARPIPQGDPNVFEAPIDEDRVHGPVLPGARDRRARWASSRLTVYLSLNYLAEAQLEVGSRLPLRLLPERMRVF